MFHFLGSQVSPTRDFPLDPHALPFSLGVRNFRRSFFFPLAHFFLRVLFFRGHVCFELTLSLFPPLPLLPIRFLPVL